MGPVSSWFSFVRWLVYHSVLSEPRVTYTDSFHLQEICLRKELRRGICFTFFINTGNWHRFQLNRRTVSSSSLLLLLVIERYRSNKELW